MPDEKKAFSVNDRRHFTAAGEARTDAAAAEPGRAPQGNAAAIAEDGADAAEPSVDLASFLLSLAAQGATFLEGEKPDLGGARSFISILEMLKDKTEGRRTPDEDRILDRVLYELRMAYLSRARAVQA